MTTRESPTVDVAAEETTGRTLVVGQATLGMAGITAADYLVRHADATEIGHLVAGDLPRIAPFEDGVPHHHGRFFSLADLDLTVLVEELFVPVGAARTYADALLGWIADRNVEEIAVLHGIPYPHGPAEHDVFHVATPQYRERRLADRDVPPLKGGFLDGVVGELVTQTLDDPTLRTGVFVTPAHPPGPDVEAALQLLDTLEDVYGFAVDETELRDLGAQLEAHHEQLADRMAALTEGEEGLRSHDYPEDRMYM